MVGAEHARGRLGRGHDVVLDGIDAELAEVLGDGRRRTGGVVGDERPAHPGLTGGCEVPGGTRHGLGTDVDHAIEVEHGQVVAGFQRLVAATEHTGLLRVMGRGRQGAPYDASMPALPPVPVPAPVVVPPALAGPVRLRPVRVRRLDLARVDAGAGDHPAESGDRLVSDSDVELDSVPALHVHEYVADGVVVRGLVGLLDLAGERVSDSSRDVAAVLPHEGVDAARAGRLADRMAALCVDPAPLLMLHRGGPRLGQLLGSVCQVAPAREGTDGRGRHHRLWAVTDPPTIAAMQAALHDAQLLLADGHHRFVAHLDLAARSPGVGDRSALAMIVDAARDAPALRSIHRVLPGASMAELAAAFEHAGHRARAGGSPHPHPARVELRSRTETRRIELVRAPGLSPLEAAHLVLQSLSGTTGQASTIHHDADEAIAALPVHPEETGVAVLLPTPTLDEVWAAAREGRLMPQKATSFQPKPPVGVLFRSWRDE